MVRYMIAMEREAEMFLRAMGGSVKGSVEVIGIGAANMCGTHEEDILVNVGYVGGHGYAVGSLVEPVCVADIKKKEVARVDPLFPLKRAVCFTSESFIEKPIVQTRAVYDMELFKIAEKPHKRLHSIKIVSDNLREEDCVKYNNETAWGRVARLVTEYICGG